MKKDSLLVVVSLMIFVLTLVVISSTYGDLQGVFTGHSIRNSSAEVRIEILSDLRVEFTLDMINWGEGYVLGFSNFSIIDTLGNVVNGTWENVSEGFVIRNVGNVNATIALGSLNGHSFIGGSGPTYKYNVTNLVGNCVPASGFSLGEFYDVVVYPGYMDVCSSLAVSSEIRVDVELGIPFNSLTGNLSDVFSMRFDEANV